MKVQLIGLQHTWQWKEFVKHLPVLWVEDSSGIFAYDENGGFLGAMVFDNWTHTSVQAHLLLLNPLLLRHGFFEACFGYVFEQRGKQLMYAMVPGDNAKSFNLIHKLGGQEKCRFEEAFKPGVDYVIMELKKTNCRYIHHG